ncbi:MAG: iron-sulfur cluster assembly accessory protein [Proteobacteria bacterium]|nr:iron-sulfur cluster assembly accessory protein [Pseudomonadota bacterium]
MQTEATHSIVTLTPAAVQHIKNHIKGEGKGCGIRISVKTTGCSGLSYIVEMVDSAPSGYVSEVIDKEVSVFIDPDPKCIAAIKGSTLDYVKQGLNQKFVFQNPNEKGACGCGESFTV